MDKEEVSVSEEGKAMKTLEKPEVNEEDVKLTCMSDMSKLV